MRQPRVKASCASICDLPIHLQQHIFASAAAPLTTCKASAGITSEPSQVAQWLLAQNQQPLQRGAAHQLWDVCELLLLGDCKLELQELERVLLEFAAAGRASLVHTLLQRSASWYPHSYRLHTLRALGRAVANHHLPLCTSLVQYPCIDAKILGWAICDAAATGFIEELQLLLARRPDITITPATWSEAMARASGKGQAQMMQHLLQHRAGLGHDTQAWLRELLRTAFVRRQVRLIAWLLAQGLTDQEAGAVLLRTLSVTSVAVITLLLTQKPGSAATLGAAAVYRALRSKRPDSARALLELIAPEHMATSWPLLVAMAPSDRAVFKSLKRRKLPHENWTPVLEAAIQHGHTQVARLLRFCGATCSLVEATEPGQ